MEKLKINLCSVGDPTDPKTWSGTPYNIYTELKNINCLAYTFNSIAIYKGRKRKLINRFNDFYYNHSVDLERGFLSRYLNAHKVKEETQKSSSRHTLHTGTYDIPFYNLPKNQKHYLFCDSTWNLWSSFSTNMKGYSKKLLKDAERLEKKAYNQMVHIFPISEYVKDNLINHYHVNPEKITVVGTGLGIIEPFQGNKNYSNGKILFAAKGRFEDKGGPLVLEAFKIASELNPSLELNIVGQNNYTTKINLPNVKTYGFIPLKELQNLFDESSLFLMPAINEPWGLVYLEALACKMPIIGLNRNSFPEISDYGNNGFVLNDADPKKLADTLINAFADPHRLEKMGAAAQKYCLEKYSWSKTVSIIVDTIQKGAIK